MNVNYEVELLWATWLDRGREIVRFYTFQLPRGELCIDQLLISTNFSALLFRFFNNQALNVIWDYAQDNNFQLTEQRLIWIFWNTHVTYITHFTRVSLVTFKSTIADRRFLTIELLNSLQLNSNLEPKERYTMKKGKFHNSSLSKT